MLQDPRVSACSTHKPPDADPHSTTAGIAAGFGLGSVGIAGFGLGVAGMGLGIAGKAAGVVVAVGTVGMAARTAVGTVEVELGIAGMVAGTAATVADTAGMVAGKELGTAAADGKESAARWRGSAVRVDNDITIPLHNSMHALNYIAWQITETSKRHPIICAAFGCFCLFLCTWS